MEGIIDQGIQDRSGVGSCSSGYVADHPLRLAEVCENPRKTLAECVLVKTSDGLAGCRGWALSGWCAGTATPY